MNPANCVRVPKRIAIGASQLMSAQASFERVQGKRAERFLRHRVFNDALVYFKFASGVTGRNKELLHTWLAIRRRDG